MIEAQRAQVAFAGWAHLSPSDRVHALRALADRLEEHREQLVRVAGQETGLTEARLAAELTRTIVQIRFFSDEVLSGKQYGVQIDEPDENFILGIRPNLRRYLVPVGPVLNFAAGNFPFAFSVCGGDTVSALAAGCPVIVKAHSGHPLLSDMTARIASEALEASGAPPHTLQVVHGQAHGLTLLEAPEIRVATFTGSTGVGRMLARRAASREKPIPFFGELGSVNPVFVTEGALRKNADAIISGLLSSISGSAGQLCTKPGYIFVPEGYDVEEMLIRALSATEEHRLLTEGISRNYQVARDEQLRSLPDEPIYMGNLTLDSGGCAWVRPTVARCSSDFLCSRPELVEEVFGPFAVLVSYSSSTDLVSVAESLFDGVLTATIHAEPDEDIAGLVSWAAHHAGRVLFGGWPTGVAVTHAQQHGGPWPATTLDMSTSVGTAALSRFLRGVAFQDVPERFLPPPLQDANPWGVPQNVSPGGESSTWGLAGVSSDPSPVGG